MSNLEPGCLARIIQSTDGLSVGRIVQCVKVRGEHPLYGTVWQISSSDKFVTEYGATGYYADIPAKWLKKIEPGELDQMKETKEMQEARLLKNVLERAAKLNW